MLNIPEVLKNTYRNDMLPFMDEPTPKDLVIYFPALDLTIETDQIVDDSFELSESLCSEPDLVFGSCEASKIKFTVADVEQDLTGQWFTIEQVIDGYDPIPLGEFRVDSCVKQDDLRFKDITTYDALKSADVDVAEWYNGLFPTGNETYTLKQFRESLLAYLGIDYEDEILPNDDMVIEKTIEPTRISGREVLRRCVELNGAFGHIGREGRFRHIILQPAYGLYPAETLYPAEDLYPVAEGDTSFVHVSIIDDTVSRYRSVRFEEYTVKEIDKLQIRAEEDDIGAIVGTGSNTYVIQGNFLVFGKPASELELIARNTYGNMANRPYRPYEAESIGLPYVEVGDTLELATDDTVVGYVLQRTLTGIQALQDKYTAEGNEEREQNFGVNEEIIQLQGKVTRIKKDVEGVSVEVEDLAQDTASRFEQTSERITQEVNDAKNELSGQIEVLAGQVILKVDANGNVAAVELGADPSEGTNITIKADNIDLSGYVTITSLNTPGSVTIDGGNLKAGTVIADSVRADWVYAGDINANQIKAGTISGNRISGGTISGVTILSTGSNGSLEIDGAYIRGRNNSGTITLDVHPSGIITNAIECNTINGYQPITRGNIGSQSVAYASSAGFAYESDWTYQLYSNSLSGYVYISSNDNFRPGTDVMGSCGTSVGRWTSIYALNGTIQTSDERKKINIRPLSDDAKFLKFAKMIVPYTYQMTEGTSGRYHVGFIAQRVEEAMAECGISDMEFAGLIKAPVYSRKLKDEEGNETEDYDITSDIIDYDYSLRYDEFIPLIFLWLRNIDINK